MSFENLPNNESSDMPNRVVHLGEPTTTSFQPHLAHYKASAIKLIESLRIREETGMVLADDLQGRLSLHGINELISESGSGLGLLIPGKSSMNIPANLRRQGREFKAITGLDDEEAKAWVVKARSVLHEAITSEVLSFDSQEFIESDIKPFLERIKDQPERSFGDDLLY